MGFIQKDWVNPVNIKATELNRIEKGIKDSHDSINILGEEVANLQLKQSKSEQNIKNILTDSPSILETLNKLQSLITNNTELIETLQNTSNLVTQSQLNTQLNSFLKLTDIKQDGKSIVNGSEINIKSQIIDTILNKGSTNAISNSAVTKALENLASSIIIPTKLSDLITDTNHLLVSQEEKNLWNTISNISFEESDPTVPSWAKQPNKPEYEWDEILYKPTIKNFIHEFPDVNNYSLTTHNHDAIYSKLTHTHDYSDIYAQLDHNHDLLYSSKSHTHKQFDSIVELDTINTLISNAKNDVIDQLIGENAHTDLDTLGEISNALQNNKDIITTLNNAIGNKADKSHTHTKANITDFTHTHTKSEITDFGSYLPLSGGTLSGNVVVKKGANWGQFQAHSASNYYRAFEADDSRVRIDVRDTISTSDRRYIDIYSGSAKADNDSSVQIVRNSATAGTTSTYVATQNWVNKNNTKLDGSNYHAKLTEPSGNDNVAGWRHIATCTLAKWSYAHLILTIKSRHSGNGLLTIGICDTNGNLATVVGSIRFYGSTDATMYTNAWKMFYNTTTGVVNVYWRFSDYNSCEIKVLSQDRFTTHWNNGEWLTTEPVAGTNEIEYLPVKYNEEYLPLTGGKLKGDINVANYNLENVNYITFNDPGTHEGLKWFGGNLWEIYEAPNDLSNAAGNLQFVTSDIRRMTIDTNGIIEANGFKGRLKGTDTRAVNSAPSVYQTSINTISEFQEFKTASTIGAPNANEKSFVYLKTIVPWGDSSGGLPSQLSIGSGIAYRTAASSSAWNAWKQLTTFTEDSTSTWAESNLTTILNKVYPIGAVYLSVNTTSPATLFGGTWTELSSGRALWITSVSSGNAGQTIAAGLPNITGNSWGLMSDASESFVCSGAIYANGAPRTRGWTGADADEIRRIGFDASRSNAIYGNSTTVQPPAIRVYAWKRTA